MAVADLDSSVGNLRSKLDLGEPFTRVRDALAEARKMGVTGRAAA